MLVLSHVALPFKSKLCSSIFVLKQKTVSYKDYSLQPGRSMPSIVSKP